MYMDEGFGALCGIDVTSGSAHSLSLHAAKLINAKMFIVYIKQDSHTCNVLFLTLGSIAPTSNKASRKYSLFNQPGGSKEPDEDGRSQRVYSYNPTAPTSNKAPRKYSLFNQPGGSKKPDEDGRSQRVYSYNPTAPTSNKAPRKYSLFNQPEGSKEPDGDGRSQQVYSYKVRNMAEETGAAAGGSKRALSNKSKEVCACIELICNYNYTIT